MDQGPGLPQNHALVFQPFIPVPLLQEVAGSGIGLTMVKTFAQLMGGDVSHYRLCVAHIVSGGLKRFG
jgi:two-component system sensor histidine kinase GlrK